MILSDTGDHRQEYVPDPPTKEPTAKRADSQREKEDRFIQAFSARWITGPNMVPISTELINRGHPARQVHTEEGTFLVTVQWLGPQTLKG